MIRQQEFILGYARVSTHGQTLEAQIDQLQAAGCVAIYHEKQSGRQNRTFRRELAKAIDALPYGGVLLVTRLDRLARSTVDIWRIVTALDERGAALRSLAEPWMDTSTPTGRLMLSVLAWAAEMERAAILERTAEGLERARRNGVKLGRPHALTDHQKAEALRLWRDEDWQFSQIAKLMGASRSTISRHLRGLPDEVTTSPEARNSAA